MEIPKVDTYMGSIYDVASFQQTTWYLIKLSGTYIKFIDSFGVA